MLREVKAQEENSINNIKIKYQKEFVFREMFENLSLGSVAMLRQFSNNFFHLQF